MQFPGGELKAMPIIQVHIVAGRSIEQKRALAESITRATADCLQAPVESVRVLIDEVPAAQWYVAGKSKSGDGNPG